MNPQENLESRKERRRGWRERLGLSADRGDKLAPNNSRRGREYKGDNDRINVAGQKKGESIGANGG